MAETAELSPAPMKEGAVKGAEKPIAPEKKEAAKFLTPAISRIALGGRVETKYFHPDALDVPDEEHKRLEESGELDYRGLDRLSNKSRAEYAREHNLSFEDHNRLFNKSIHGYIEKTVNSEDAKTDPLYVERVAALRSLGIDPETNDEKADGSELYKVGENFRTAYFGGEGNSKQFVQDLAKDCLSDDGSVDLEKLQTRLESVQGLLPSFGENYSMDVLVKNFAMTHGHFTKSDKQEIIEGIRQNAKIGVEDPKEREGLLALIGAHEELDREEKAQAEEAEKAKKKAEAEAARKAEEEKPLTDERKAEIKKEVEEAEKKVTTGKEAEEIMHQKLVDLHNEVQAGKLEPDEVNNRLEQLKKDHGVLSFDKFLDFKEALTHAGFEDEKAIQEAQEAFEKFRQLGLEPTSIFAFGRDDEEKDPHIYRFLMAKRPPSEEKHTETEESTEPVEKPTEEVAPATEATKPEEPPKAEKDEAEQPGRVSRFIDKFLRRRATTEPPRPTIVPMATGPLPPPEQEASEPPSAEPTIPALTSGDAEGEKKASELSSETQQLQPLLEKLRADYPGGPGNKDRLGREIILTDNEIAQMEKVLEGVEHELDKDPELQEVIQLFSQLKGSDAAFDAAKFFGMAVQESPEISTATVVTTEAGPRIQLPPELYRLWKARSGAQMARNYINEYKTDTTHGRAAPFLANFLEDSIKGLS